MNSELNREAKKETDSNNFYFLLVYYNDIVSTVLMSHGRFLPSCILFTSDFVSSWRPLVSHHDRENDGRHGGLEDPEQRQTQHLDEGEEVDFPEGDVPQVHQVRLVLGGHQQQLEAIHELQESRAARETRGQCAYAFTQYTQRQQVFLFPDESD